MILTVTCNPALDWAITVDELRAGAMNRTSAEHLSMGGKGVNVAWILRQLGLDAQATGFRAGVTGAALDAGLSKLDIPFDFIELPAGETRINVKLKQPRECAPGSARDEAEAAGATSAADTSQGTTLEETEINARGPRVTEAALTKLFGKVEALESGDMLVLSGSLAVGCDTMLYSDLVERAAKRDVRTTVDATGETLLAALSDGPFLIKPNAAELAEIAACDESDRETLLTQAVYLARRGARYVLVSCGGDGAFLVDADGPLAQAKAPKGTLVNSVGAGDSMVAGFLAGIAGVELPESDVAAAADDASYALRMAIACGSATAFSADLATRAEIANLLPTVEVEKLR